MRREFPLQMVRERSKSFQIPYENMLIACSKERILQHFLANQKTALKETIAFYGMAELGMEHYRYRKDAVLEVKVLAPAFTEEILCDIKASFVSEEELARWTVREESKVELEVLVPFDKLNVPIRVKFELSDARKGLLQTLTLPLLHENAERIQIPCFFPEAEVAMRFLEVWEKLTLLQEVSQLECIYNLGRTFTMDGRRIALYLRDFIDEGKWEYTKDRSDLLFASKESTHLRKRYKAYLSTEKRKEPTWEEVMNLFNNLYEPILNCIEKEEIFFGDWMPAVARYL